jgi:hypothetical protein
LRYTGPLEVSTIPGRRLMRSGGPICAKKTINRLVTIFLLQIENDEYESMALQEQLRDNMSVLKSGRFAHLFTCLKA